MKINIFYSWQSDKPSRINRNLIQEAAQLAIDRIISGNEFVVEPALDRDTQDISGSPAIADAILSKIDQCALFLCDVSIVTEPVSNRSAPNPNVLIELGYAAARVGWERIICVMNENYGGPKKLPFDLQHRRWPIRYRLADTADDESVNKIRESLSENIEYAIRSVIQSGIITATINPKDRRVAMKLSSALNSFIGTLAIFLTSHGYQDGMKIILQDYPDEPGSEYPSTSLVAPILNVLSQNTLKSPSNAQIGDRKISWAELFVSDLMHVSQDCEQILDQYADRDDTIISLVDEINNRAKNLASMISTSVNVPELTSFYDKGIPSVHMDFFRYFFLASIKSYRIIRQYGVKVE
jgi:hypothetical protein